jgi:hypothetical protein
MTEDTSGWQTMDSAPKDGTKVDIYARKPCGHGKFYARRFPDCFWGADQWIGLRDGWKAKYWRSLPNPPSEVFIERMEGPAFQRQMVRLAPGEKTPDSYTPYIAPPDGFRWENDDEFRKRIAREIGK